MKATAEPERVFGWKAIADALEVSIDSGQRFAARNRDPLPVEVGHRGVWAYVSALSSWMRRQNLPYQAARMLRPKRSGCGRATSAPGAG